MSVPSGCVDSCRACSHREKSLEESLAQKVSWLRDKLEPWQDLLRPIVHLPRERQYHYRDKVCLSASWNNDGWIFGMKKRDDIIAIPDCPVHSPRINLTQKILHRYLPGPVQLPLAYYVQSGAQIVLVVKAASIPKGIFPEAMFSDLKEAGNEGFWLHLHPSAGRKVFSKTNWELVWGHSYSRAHDGLYYGPMSFQQVIPELHLQVIGRVTDHFLPVKTDGVIDLYCGTGETMKVWTDSGASAIGVELSGEAVACSELNVPGVNVLRGRCRDRIPQLNEWLYENKPERLLLFINPPRTGIEPEVIRWITETARPLKIAYLSCSAGTLRRDLEWLAVCNYSIIEIIPYDFFPRTHHIECLVLLQLV